MSGIGGGSGYSYQQYIFIIYVLKYLGNNEYDKVCYESEDDDDISIYLSSGKKYFIQVKNKDISKDDKIKTLKNWILGDKENIHMYILVHSSKKSVNLYSPFQTNDDITIFFNQIKNSCETSNASLYNKLKTKFSQYSDEEFIEYFKHIKDNTHLEFIDVEKVEEEILKNGEIHFNKEKCEVNIYKERITKFKERILSNLNDSLNNKKPYTYDKTKMASHKENIISSNPISPEYDDYGNFKNQLNLDLKDIENIREYIQLSHCYNNKKDDEIKKIKQYLIQMKYYQYKRDKDLIDFKEMNVEQNEKKGKNNFDLVIEQLKLKSEDTPIWRLLNTVEKRLFDDIYEFSNGLYIFLTGDDTDEDLKISWKDDNNCDT